MEASGANQWKIGDVKITRVVESEGPWDGTFILPSGAPILGRFPPIESFAAPGVRIRPLRQTVSDFRRLSERAARSAVGLRGY